MFQLFDQKRVVSVLCKRKWKKGDRKRGINKRAKDSSIVVWKVRESKAFVPEATALMPFEARRPLDEGEDEGGGEERPEISSLRGEDPTTGVLFCKDSAPDDEDDEEEGEEIEAAYRDSSLMRSSTAILTLGRYIFFQSSEWQEATS